MRTGMGTRAQPLMIAATTAGDDPASFAKAEHEECLRIQDNPERAPHRLVYIKYLPTDADPWDESLWPQANPALGDFLSIEALREEALEARNDPSKENSFRQYRCNQWVSQATRWMPMHLYEATADEVWPTPEFGRTRLAGRQAWCGFDLSAKLDMTAWCLVFPDGAGGIDVLWRFWVTEAATEYLAKHAEVPIVQWARDGWLTVTDGEVLDYEQVYADVGADANMFKILGGDGDSWSMYPVIQELAKRTSLKADEDLVLYANTFERMTPGMVGLMGLVKQQRFRHHGNPVAAWHFDVVQVKRVVMNPDLMRPEKPQRDKEAKRIDAVPAACMAVAAWQTRGQIVKPRRKVRVMR
jgi:phage terminase large subunit-like protein